MGQRFPLPYRKPVWNSSHVWRSAGGLWIAVMSTKLILLSDWALVTCVLPPSLLKSRVRV